MSDSNIIYTEARVRLLTVPAQKRIKNLLCKMN